MQWLRKNIDWSRPPIYVFLIGLGMFLYSGWPAFHADATAYLHTTLTVNDPTITAVKVCGAAFTERPQDGGALQADTSCLDRAGSYPAVAARRGGQDVSIHVQILPRGRTAMLAGGGVLLIMLAAPGVLFGATNVKVQGTGEPVKGWAYLLTEPQGLSLSRFQLVVWFVPAFVIFAILSWPVHQFPTLTDTMWQLLGLSGATAALGIASTPSTTDKGTPPAGAGPSDNPTGAPAPKPAIDVGLARTELDALQQALGQFSMALQESSAALQLGVQPAAPAPARQLELVRTQWDTFVQRLNGMVGQATAKATAMKAALDTASDVVYVARPEARDLVEDFSGFGDVSRYQYLLLCLGSALTFFVSFLQSWEIPTLPSQLVGLMAGSQATYLVVKGIKNLQK